MTCPFRPLEEEEARQEEDADARPEGSAQLQAAVGTEEIPGGVGLGELVGPLLALFTVVRGIQQLGGLPVGNITKAGMAEEATTRVLRPQVPAREGPSPARPGKAPSGPGRVPARTGGGGGFFTNQAAELKMMLGRK